MGDERVLSTAVNINQLPRLLIELAPTFAANQVKFVSAAGGDPADPASLLQFMFDMKEKIDNQYYYNGRNQESIRAEIEQDVLENADENTPDDIINQEVVRRMDELKRRAGPISRIYGLLSDSITFLQFLSQAISNSLIGKDLRTFIRIAAREAFKLNNKAINSALRVGENISPNNVALAGPFAGQLQVTANTPVAAPVRRTRPRVAEE